MNLLSITGELIRLGARTLTPDERDLLQEYDQQLKEFKEKLERQEQEREQSATAAATVISSKEDLMEALNEFTRTGDANTLEQIYDHIMRNESCPFCRSMISTAMSEMNYGNSEKAKGFATELINYYNIGKRREKKEKKKNRG